jgi:hypothetical protein
MKAIKIKKVVIEPLNLDLEEPFRIPSARSTTLKMYSLRLCLRMALRVTVRLPRLNR